MNILGVDLAIGTCGYAVVQSRPVRVLDIGLIETVGNDDVDVSVSDGLRINRIGNTLLGAVRRHGVTMLAFEQRLSFGAKRAIAAQALCAGLVQGIACAEDLDLVELVAKVWQDAVMPGVFELPKPQRYPKVERELARFIGHALDHVPPAKRTHPLDGFGVGLCAALSPHLCRTIRRRAAACPVERVTPVATEGATP